jgi:uncharacterized integral membrane protein
MALSRDDQPPARGWQDLDEGGPGGGKGKTGRDVRVRATIAGIALVVALIFVFQNSKQAETNFLFLHGSQPLWFMILICLLLGALLGQGLGMLRRREKREKKQS